MKSRSEPLLWLQLLGLGAIPLELLLVLLLLAGSDPGPFPGVERLLTWGLGAVAPSVLLWRMPPDPLSLVVVCTAVQRRTPTQLGLTKEPMGLPLKVLLASGTALLLPLLWWLDTTSVLASSYALLATTNRLVALVAVAPLLTLMVWQWQQLLQATVLLSRDQQAKEPPEEPEGWSVEGNEQRLCLGLPWLYLPALVLPELPEEPAKTFAMSQPDVPQALEGPSEAGPSEALQDDAAEPEASQEDPEGNPPNTETAAFESEEIEAPGESASELEVMPDNSTEDWSAAELAIASEGQDSLAIAPKDSQLVPPEENQFRGPVITDVEFTPVDATPLESAPIAIEPEETAEEAEGSDLDPEIG